jgi:hypothetical protein
MKREPKPEEAMAGVLLRGILVAAAGMGAWFAFAHLAGLA